MGHRQPFRDRAHPVRQRVERDVDAAEDEQQREDEIREDCQLPHPQRDRRVRDPERGTGERGRRHRQHEQRQRAARDLDVEHECAECEARQRDGDADRHRRQAAAEEDCEPARGRREQVRQRLRSPLAGDRLAHREEPGQRRELDRVADDVERVRLELGRPAEIGEEEHLEERRHDQRRDEQGRMEPAEEAAEAEQPADQGDADGRHVSERDAWRRADSRKRPRSSAPTTVYTALSRTHIAMSTSTEPPAKAASLSARMPQVGASSHETGSTHDGRSATGIRSPVTSQTGYSNMFPTAQPARKRTITDAITNPSRPIETIVGGIASANSSGLLELERDPEHEPAPEQRRHERVDPDRRGRDRDREQHGPERRRRRHEQLEHAERALPLDRVGGVDGRHRPDPHHGRTDRGEQQRLRLAARAEHEVGERGVDQRPDRRRHHREGVSGQVLEVEDDAQPDDPAGARHAVTSCT